MNTAGVNHQRDMVIRFRQLTFGVSHQFAMISFQHKYRIIKPGLFTCLFKKLTQSPIRVLNNLRLGFTRFRMEERRYHIRRMIADGQQSSKERLSGGSPLIQYRNCIVIQEIILYSEAIHNLISRIIFLWEHFIIAVCPEKSVHIIILPFVRHKEKVIITVFFQDSRQSRIAGNDRAFHEVSFHHRRERI